MAPTFSIVMATWNRGRRIVPTIKSVLRQTFTDYELLIIGDGCDDDTEAAVRPYLSERVRWKNLAERAGHQATPNNAGLAAARGRYVAYLGHDDVWAPNHLAALLDVYAGDPELRFAVSGCIVHGPPGSGYNYIAGLFEGELVKFDQFLPPSALSHRLDVIGKIGNWGDPYTLKAPPDVDFVLRAVHAGMRFAPTRRITVHKFGAAVRYLTYLRQESYEQEITLRLMKESGYPAYVDRVAEQARRTNTFMNLPMSDFSKLTEGQFIRGARMTSGVIRPALQPLIAKVVLEQDDGWRGFDWGEMMKSRDRIGRWSWMNPRPKFLIPLAAEAMVGLRFRILDVSDPAVINGLEIRVNGHPVRWWRRGRVPGKVTAVLRCRARLKPDDHSFVQFDLTGGVGSEELIRAIEARPERIALGEVSVFPLPWHKRYWPLPAGFSPGRLAR